MIRMMKAKKIPHTDETAKAFTVANNRDTIQMAFRNSCLNFYSL